MKNVYLIDMCLFKWGKLPRQGEIVRNNQGENFSGVLASTPVLRNIVCSGAALTRLLTFAHCLFVNCVCLFPPVGWG